MRQHPIAITPVEFEASVRGLRNAEHRWEDLRDPFNVGDLVILEELTTENPRRRELTGRKAVRMITWIDRGMGVRYQYAMLHLGAEEPLTMDHARELAGFAERD